MSVFIPEESMSSVLFDGYTSNTVVFGTGAPVVTTEVLYPASHVVSPADFFRPPIHPQPNLSGRKYLNPGRIFT